MRGTMVLLHTRTHLYGLYPEAFGAVPQQTRHTVGCRKRISNTSSPSGNVNILHSGPTLCDFIPTEQMFHPPNASPKSPASSKRSPKLGSPPYHIHKSTPINQGLVVWLLKRRLLTPFVHLGGLHPVHALEIFDIHPSRLQRG